MKAPTTLKEDVSNNSPYQFLEKNRNKFESMYDQKPETAIAGTKHTITTSENKVIHQKRARKPLKMNFQNPFLRRGKRLRTRRQIYDNRRKHHS